MGSRGDREIGGCALIIIGLVCLFAAVLTSSLIQAVAAIAAIIGIASLIYGIQVLVRVREDTKEYRESRKAIVERHKEESRRERQAKKERR